MCRYVCSGGYICVDIRSGNHKKSPRKPTHYHLHGKQNIHHRRNKLLLKKPYAWPFVANSYIWWNPDFQCFMKLFPSRSPKSLSLPLFLFLSFSFSLSCIPSAEKKKFHNVDPVIYLFVGIAMCGVYNVCIKYFKLHISILSGRNQFYLFSQMIDWTS